MTPVMLSHAFVAISLARSKTIGFFTSYKYAYFAVRLLLHRLTANRTPIPNLARIPPNGLDRKNSTGRKYEIIFKKNQRPFLELRSLSPPAAAALHGDPVTVTSPGKSPAFPPMCSTSIVPPSPAPAASGVLGATFTAGLWWLVLSS